MTEKKCPKCGELLKEKSGSRYCENGCEIYTACPHGTGFTTHRAGAEDGKTMSVGDGLRRMPKLEE